MDKEYESIINNVRLGLIVLFFILFITIIYITKNTKDDRIEYILNKDYQSLEVHYLLTTKYFKQIALNSYKRIVSNKKVLDIFWDAFDADEPKRDILRKQLYKTLFGQYQYMKNLGIYQFHFVFPDNVSFLRFHTPERYGDILNSVRYSYDYVHKNRNFISGLEEGRTTPDLDIYFLFLWKAGI